MAIITINPRIKGYRLSPKGSYRILATWAEEHDLHLMKQGTGHLYRLWGNQKKRKVQGDFFRSPNEDHPSLWGRKEGRKKVPYCFVSQPYQARISDCVAFAIKWELTLDIYPPSHSWYYPGSTLLLVWKRLAPLTPGAASSVIRFHDGAQRSECVIMGRGLL